jgi:hypothetical protein
MNGYSIFKYLLRKDLFSPSSSSHREGIFYKVVLKIFLIVANLCEIAD